MTTRNTYLLIFKKIYEYRKNYPEKFYYMPTYVRHSLHNYIIFSIKIK